MNNQERLVKINELNKRAMDLGVGIAPVISYQTSLNNNIIEEGIGRTICKAYYKYILQYWMGPINTVLTSSTENNENLFIKAMDGSIIFRSDYDSRYWSGSSSTGYYQNYDSTNYNNNNGWFYATEVAGYRQTSMYNDSIIIGSGIGPDDIDRHELVQIINWNKTYIPYAPTTFDEYTGIYTKTITCGWTAGPQDEDRIIREIGLVYSVKIKSSELVTAGPKSFLFDRAQLDNPITVKRTDTLNITYTVQFQVPWHK